MVAVRIFLLLLVLAVDANCFDVAIQETPGNCSFKNVIPLIDYVYLHTLT